MPAGSRGPGRVVVMIRCFPWLQRRQSAERMALGRTLEGPKPPALGMAAAATNVGMEDPAMRNEDIWYLVQVGKKRPPFENAAAWRADRALHMSCPLGA
eukprot:CAMPEP_0117564314 /NCGR_PEP_ID=MMETSP0784-20121206/55963_1 /TAXON_ID=39447 /ORGANISM="" /LENGTH=98 /DNA_ID=CAMNT_0005362021 /DNA_START=83 /DNA_END=376 /DNA_ORIENTATION=+